MAEVVPLPWVTEYDRTIPPPTPSEMVLIDAAMDEVDEVIVIGRLPSGDLYVRSDQTIGDDKVIASLMRAVTWLSSTERIAEDVPGAG